MTPETCNSPDTEAQAVNVALDQGTNYIAEAITGQWGERCSEYAEGCACCEAWKQYDGLLSQSAALASAREVIEPFARAAEKYGLPYLAKCEQERAANPRLNLPRGYGQAVDASAEQTCWNHWDAAREWKGR